MMSFVAWKVDNMETVRTLQIMLCVVSHKLDNKFVSYRPKCGSFMYSRCQGVQKLLPKIVYVMKCASSQASPAMQMISALF